VFKKVDYVMITVSDMNRSVKFYRDTLGIPVKFESPDWTEFETGATTLALHGGGKPAKQPSASAGPADQGMDAGVCTIGFSVPDLDRSYRDLQSKGVRFVMQPTKREEEGILLSVFLDPDGMPISIAQSLR
jgi:lactoylglutathione lyase